MSFLGKDIIFTEDPELVKHVLTGPGWTNFPKGERFQGIFNDFLGVGIFNSDGAQWKHHRSLTRPFFSKDEISNIETFDKHASIMINIVKKLRSHPQKTRASFPAQIAVGKSAAIDIQDLVGRFTLDSATEFLFGTPVDSLYEVDSTLFSQESKEKKINAGDFFRAFNEVQEKTQRRLQADPFWKVAELVHNPIKAEMKHISPLVDSIIESALKSPATISADQEKKGDLKSTVFLNHLIAVTQDPKEIRDELLNVLLAARDTTHSLIISTIYEMSRNVVIWKKLRDEVIAAFPFKAEPVDVDAMRKLKYLRSVLNESLRMHPPVPFNFRSTVNEDIIDIKGTRYYLPAKCPIAYGLYPMQRREDLWGPDAGIYDPERWLDSRSKRQTSNPFIFQPFSAGPRICLGQQYAYNEASLCIVRLLQHFESVEWASDAQPSESIYTNEKGQPDIARYAAITLSFRGGFWVRFTEAKN
ncbi:cytochrome P450 [Atractiella rhizophila]|nr:cytochrome P450 [Atractiella rhizophila]